MRKIALPLFLVFLVVGAIVFLIHGKPERYEKGILHINMTASRQGFNPSIIILNSSRYGGLNLSIKAIDVTHSFKIDGVVYEYLPVGVEKHVWINTTGMSGRYRFYSDVYAGPGVKLEGFLDVVS